jgi:hypothetical protein
MKVLAVNPRLCGVGLATIACVCLMARLGSPSFDFGLANLPILTDAQTRSVSAENPTGEKGQGGMAVPNAADPHLPFSKVASDLGPRLEVNPFLKPKAHER